MTSEKNGLAFIFLGGCILLQVVSLTLVKMAALQIETFNFISVITNVLYLFSFIFFFLRSVIWQLVLKYLPLSVAYPVMSLSIVMVLLVGRLFFGESITWNNLLGTVVIMFGIIILNTVSKQEND